MSLDIPQLDYSLHFSTEHAQHLEDEFGELASGKLVALRSEFSTEDFGDFGEPLQLASNNEALILCLW